MTNSSKREDRRNVSAETDEDSTRTKSNLKGDWQNLAFLLMLYIMQAIPIGVSTVIPILLQSKKTTSYNDQALFSLTKSPYILKLFWAPLVDTFYVQKMGRRKSWLIPVQYTIGAILLFIAYDVDDLLPENGTPNIAALVCVFFTLLSMTATQDIVVDSWALTLLQKRNVCYVSTCNAMGGTIGTTSGYLLTILLTSEVYCNKYLRVTPATGGVTTMKSILYFLGVMFVFITTLIAIFKKENGHRLEDDHVKLNIFQNYKMIWDILKLPSVRILAIALVTVKIGSATTDFVSTLKLIDAGIPKEDIVVINSTVNNLKIILLIFFAKLSTGSKSMSLYVNIIPIKLLLNVAYGVLTFYTPKLIIFNGVKNIPMYYYTILILLTSIRLFIPYFSNVIATAFFSRISDLRFGATYMTLLTSITYIGTLWPSPISLGMIDLLTTKQCSIDFENDCSTLDLKNVCKAHKGQCIITKDGYYYEIIVCTIIGIFWYFIFRNFIKNIQNKSASHWLVVVKNPSAEDDNILVVCT